MNRHMVEEAGSRFLELASSFGKLHADTLSGLADATSKTPFGPVFAINASLARMANDGIETLATRVNGAVADAPVTRAPVSSPVPAPKPAVPIVPKAAPKPEPVAAKAPVPAAPAPKAPEPQKAAKPAPKVVEAPAFKTMDAPKPKPVESSAPFEVHTDHATSISDFDEPDVGDVLIDDALVEDVLAEVERKPVALADKDDLTLINGIGATTAKKLNGIGIESFAQIAAMSETAFTELLASLDIKTIRFSPAVWIKEAQTRSTRNA